MPHRHSHHKNLNLNQNLCHLWQGRGIGLQKLVHKCLEGPFQTTLGYKFWYRCLTCGCRCLWCSCECLL